MPICRNQHFTEMRFVLKHYRQQSQECKINDISPLFLVDYILTKPKFSLKHNHCLRIKTHADRSITIDINPNRTIKRAYVTSYKVK